NTNCMLHGAMSITGLALVVSGAVPLEATLALWIYVLGVFVTVEAIEIVRLIARIRAYGLRRGALTYRVTQWSRNFTFGMFVAFTLALIMHGGAAEAAALAAVQRAVVAYGPYVVVALLIVEIAVYLDGRVSGRDRLRHSPASAGTHPGLVGAPPALGHATQPVEEGRQSLSECNGTANEQGDAHRRDDPRKE